MSANRGGNQQQQVDDLIKPGAVKSLSEEPEKVTLERLKNERVKFVAIVCVAAAFGLLISAFLIYVYLTDASDTTKDRIALGLIGALTLLVGVVAGKKL